jgi:hypothetical protein
MSEARRLTLSFGEQGKAACAMGRCRGFDGGRWACAGAGQRRQDGLPFSARDLQAGKRRRRRWEAAPETNIRSVDQAGGVAVRLLTPNNYYVVRANALENNVRFYRVIDGKREQLASADVTVSRNEWHELGIRAEGDRFTISFDGKRLYAASDKTLTRAGKIALWTKADSVTRFDRIRIQSLP